METSELVELMLQNYLLDANTELNSKRLENPNKIDLLLQALEINWDEIIERRNTYYLNEEPINLFHIATIQKKDAITDFKVIFESISILMSLRHPQICELYGVTVDPRERNYYLVVPGYEKNLGNYLSTYKSLQEKLKIIIQFVKVGWFLLSLGIAITEFPLQKTFYSIENDEVEIKVLIFLNSEAMESSDLDIIKIFSVKTFNSLAKVFREIMGQMLIIERCDLTIYNLERQIEKWRSDTERIRAIGFVVQILEEKNEKQEDFMKVVHACLENLIE
jgi:hypothetical protein